MAKLNWNWFKRKEKAKEAARKINSSLGQLTGNQMLFVVSFLAQTIDIMIREQNSPLTYGYAAKLMTGETPGQALAKAAGAFIQEHKTEPDAWGIGAAQSFQESEDLHLMPSDVQGFIGGLDPAYPIFYFRSGDATYQILSPSAIKAGAEAFSLDDLEGDN